MNIVLIGYRCSGKTTVGRLLARELGRDFLDTDRLIEAKTDLPIHVYVLRNGWKDFRLVERQVIEEVASKDNIVIATGGGVVVDQENVRNLKKNGWVVWLDTGASVIRERMKDEQKGGNFRPTLSGGDPFKEIDTILHKRMPAYKCASDYRVGTDGQTLEEVEQAIMRALPHKHKDGNGGTC